jgi:hypothetical protein
MKITHALTADSRWDTYRQSRTRATSRMLRDDVAEQLFDMTEGEWPEADTDVYGDGEYWLCIGQDEFANVVWYQTINGKEI